MKKRYAFHFAAVLIVMMAMTVLSGTAAYGLGGGALAGNRYRVIISTDIGGSDEDIN